MSRRWPPALAVLGLSAACAGEPVRLYELAEAPPGSREALAYQRLQEAVGLANEFLHTASSARVFPAERATFFLSYTDILVEYRNEGVEPVRIEAARFGDVRTMAGDRVHPDDDGFLSARVGGPDARGDATDALFLHLPVEEMAAVLLRQTAMQREVRARGNLDYWANYALLGFWPAYGWGKGNPVNARAHAVEAAFWKWLREERGGASAAPPEWEEPATRQPEDYQEPT